MTVCKILIMLDSVSGPKPVCLQQVTVHLDLESLNWAGVGAVSRTESGRAFQAVTVP